MEFVWGFEEALVRIMKSIKETLALKIYPIVLPSLYRQTDHEPWLVVSPNVGPSIFNSEHSN